MVCARVCKLDFVIGFNNASRETVIDTPSYPKIAVTTSNIKREREREIIVFYIIEGIREDGIRSLLEKVRVNNNAFGALNSLLNVCFNMHNRLFIFTERERERKREL